MPAPSTHIETITGLLNATAIELAGFLENCPEDRMNSSPFEESWTIAQVADHLTLSNHSVAKALSLTGVPVNRAPDERADELEEIFLDFSKQYKAPEFIMPTTELYLKNELLQRLRESFRAIKETAEQTDLFVLINHPAFGDISKLEILYFVWFHTQRHLRQVKNILHYLEGKQ